MPNGSAGNVVRERIVIRGVPRDIWRDMDTGRFTRAPGKAFLVKFSTRETHDGKRTGVTLEFEVIIKASDEDEAYERALEIIGEATGGTPLSELWESVEWQVGIQATAESPSRPFFRKMTGKKVDYTQRLES